MGPLTLKTFTILALLSPLSAIGQKVYFIEKEEVIHEVKSQFATFTLEGGVLQEFVCRIKSQVNLFLILFSGEKEKYSRYSWCPPIMLRPAGWPVSRRL